MRQWAWGFDRKGATRTSGLQAFGWLLQGSDDIAVRYRDGPKSLSGSDRCGISSGGT